MIHLFIVLICCMNRGKLLNNFKIISLCLRGNRSQHDLQIIFTKRMKKQTEYKFIHNYSYLPPYSITIYSVFHFEFIKDNYQLYDLLGLSHQDFQLLTLKIHIFRSDSTDEILRQISAYGVASFLEYLIINSIF